MEYIVVFNVESKDCEVLTDEYGFTEKFTTFEDAYNGGLKWLDSDEYRNFKVFAECNHDRNHVV